MDNIGPHGTDLLDICEQATIWTLPLNCTAVHEPMDLGIIVTWKRVYCRLKLCDIFKSLETCEEKSKSSRTLIDGVKELDEGQKPIMLDVTRLSLQS